MNPAFDSDKAKFECRIFRLPQIIFRSHSRSHFSYFHRLSGHRNLPRSHPGILPEMHRHKLPHNPHEMPAGSDYQDSDDCHRCHIHGWYGYHHYYYSS
jgi:hypothetical protein